VAAASLEVVYRYKRHYYNCSSLYVLFKEIKFFKNNDDKYIQMLTVYMYTQTPKNKDKNNNLYIFKRQGLVVMGSVISAASVKSTNVNLQRFKLIPL
jgi:hypothetical protein